MLLSRPIDYDLIVQSAVILLMKKDIDSKKNTFQVVSEYIQALVGAVVLAVLIRGFVFEPFKIPSESMVPTLLVGDHIFVARYQYGLRIPFTKIWIKEFDDPKRGDVVVFNYPEDEDVDFIKRIVGLPGDKVAVKEGVLYVNDKEMTDQEFYPQAQNDEDACVMDLTAESEKIFPDGFKKFPFFLKHKRFVQMLETFDNKRTHMIQRSINNPVDYDFEFSVPSRSFFVMGDNRDQSQDSRFWGIVPRENLKGKAIYIWLSLNNEKTECRYNFLHTDFLPGVRWDRFGRKII